MADPTIQLQLPEPIYERLHRMAEATHQPLEAVVLQTIRGNLPPALEDLQPAWQPLVAELQPLGDQALWEVAHASVPPRQWRRHQHLLRKAQAATLTAAEQQELTTLREATDAAVLRRSYALALLKWRGYTLPAHG